MTTSTGTTTEDNEPNTPAPGGAPGIDFELLIEAVAGNVIGATLAPYTLTVTCIDEVLAAPNPAMSVGPLNQKFGDAGDGWTGPVGAVGNLTLTKKVRILVPNGARGHVFHYVGALVDQPGNVVSFLRGNSFILV